MRNVFTTLLLFFGLVCFSSAASAQPPAVARAVFTSAVKAHEPVDAITRLTNDHGRLYFFTELDGLAGHTITHRWIYQGKVMAEIDFKVKSDRWRVWSSKHLLPEWTGEWQVDIVEQDGTVLDTSTFEYVPVATER